MRKMLPRLAAFFSQVDSPSNNFIQLFRKFKSLRNDSLPDLLAIFQQFINNAQLLRKEDLRSIGWDIGKALSFYNKYSIIEIYQLLDKSALYGLLDQQPELRSSFAPLVYNIYAQVMSTKPDLSQTLISQIFDLGVIYTIPKDLLLLLQELYKKKAVKSHLTNVLGIMLRHNYQSEMMNLLDIFNLSHQQRVFLLHNKLINIASSIIDKQKFSEANNYRYIYDINMLKDFTQEIKMLRMERAYSVMISALRLDLNRPAVKRMAHLIKPLFKDQNFMSVEVQPIKDSFGKIMDIFFKAGFYPKLFYCGPYMPSLQYAQQKVLVNFEDEISKVYTGPDRLTKSAEGKYRDILHMITGSKVMNLRGMQPEMQILDMIRMVKQIQPRFMESI